MIKKVWDKTKNWVKNAWIKVKKWILILLVPVTLAAGLVGQDIIERGKIPEHLKLKTNKENILGSWEQDFIECDELRMNCVNYGRYKYYKYNTDIEIPAALPNEIINRRTVRSRTYKKGENLVIDFHSGTPLYLKNDKVYRIKQGKTTIKAFKLQTKASLPERVLGLLVGKDVSADTLATYSEPDGDGYIYEDGSYDTWDTNHDDTNGDTSDNSGVVMWAYSGCTNNGDDTNIFYRAYNPMLTGEEIGALDTLVSGNFKVYVVGTNTTGGTDYNYIGLIASTSQAATNNLATQDYELCGETSAAVGGSLADSLGSDDEPDVTVIPINAWLDWNLNQDGLDEVRKNGEASSCGGGNNQTCFGLRTGNDIWDIHPDCPTFHTGNGFSFNTTNNGSNMPTFRIEYTPFAEEEEEIIKRRYW